MDIEKIKNAQRRFTEAIFPRVLRKTKTTFTNIGDAT